MRQHYAQSNKQKVVETMSERVQVGNIGLHNVTRDNIACKVTDHDGFSCISIDLGMTTVTLFTTTDDVAAIRRILGGW